MKDFVHSIENIFAQGLSSLILLFFSFYFSFRTDFSGTQVTFRSNFRSNTRRKKEDESQMRGKETTSSFTFTFTFFSLFCQTTLFRNESNNKLKSKWGLKFNSASSGKRYLIFIFM